LFILEVSFPLTLARLLKNTVIPIPRAATKEKRKEQISIATDNYT